MQENLNNFVVAVEAVTGKPAQRSGRGFRVCCPAHNGDDRNLYIGPGRGSIIIKCHSHDCTRADILRAAGVDHRTLKTDHTGPIDQTKRRQFELEEARQHQLAADVAYRLWHHESRAMDGCAQHQYLIKKRIKPHGTRLYKGWLIIPMFVGTELVNLQKIGWPHPTTGKTQKYFIPGGRVKGASCAIGWRDDAETILVAEGFATAATLHEQTNEPVVMAFSSWNMTAVARQLRAANPLAKLVIAGDNDIHGKGQQAATKAAAACGGVVFLPPTVGDWNDYYAAIMRRAQR